MCAWLSMGCGWGLGSFGGAQSCRLVRDRYAIPYFLGFGEFVFLL